MASAAENILEEIVGHQIRLDGLSASILRKIMRLLDDAENDILARILRRDVEGLTTRQLEALLKNIEAINANAAKELGKVLVEDLGALAVYEAGYQAGLLQRFIPVAIQFASNTPSRNQLIAAVQSRPFEGRLLREWIDQFDVNSANRIKAAVRLGIVEGQTTDQIVRRIRGTRAANYEDGVWNKSRRGAEALVRTATNHTANYARELTWAENDDMVKGVKWVSVLDLRTSAICASRDNKVYPLGKGPRPPAHINCLTGDCLITSSPGITGASKRWFDGEVVVIQTSGGRKLTCTPNHPVLTHRGWVVAGKLNFSDKIVCDLNIDGAALVNAQDDDGIASIGNVVEAFLAHSGVLSSKVPTSAPDFHGDGANSEVAIVGAYRGLRAKHNPSIAQKISKPLFVSGDNARSRLRTLCQFLLRGFAPFGRFIGFGYKLFAQIKASASHSCKLLLSAIARLMFKRMKDFLDCTWRRLQSFRNAANTNAVNMQALDLFSVDVSNASLMLANSINSLRLQGSKDDALADTRLATSLRNGAAFDVELDCILQLNRISFSGHVYNLETVDGYYVANGIVTHNCRSTTTPVLKSWRELGFNIDDLPPGTRASMNGQVPADLSYGEWLKRRSREDVEEVLGKTKAKLFLDGDLPIEKFVRRDGHEYTLKELAKRDAAAFERANINTE